MGYIVVMETRYTCTRPCVVLNNIIILVDLQHCSSWLSAFYHWGDRKSSSRCYSVVQVCPLYIVLFYIFLFMQRLSLLLVPKCLYIYTCINLHREMILVNACYEEKCNVFTELKALTESLFI